MYFGVASNHLNHTYNYRRLRAEEWLAGGDRVNGILEQLSQVLNSNENFEMDDSFQLTFTRVCAPPRGSGKRKMKPGHRHSETFKRIKQTVITINNNDQLWCARAIITAKAKLEEHLNWYGFQKGTKVQKTEAIDLHLEANIPLGPCGYDELKKFALAPSLSNYQLVLVDEMHGYQVSRFGSPKDKQLVLLYSGEHYNVIISLPGFLAASYFCDKCLKPYNNQGQHVCSNNPDHCPACLQNKCTDYKQDGRASTFCSSCRPFFYGDTCFEQHLSKSYKGTAVNAKNVSVCTQHRKCVQCY